LYSITKGKGKGHTRTGHEGQEGEKRYNYTLSLTSALDGSGWSTPRPGRSLPPGKIRYPLCRRLSAPQGRSGQVRKISPPPTGIRFPSHPVLSESLYRLSYSDVRRNSANGTLLGVLVRSYLGFSLLSKCRTVPQYTHTCILFASMRKVGRSLLRFARKSLSVSSIVRRYVVTNCHPKLTVNMESTDRNSFMPLSEVWFSGAPSSMKLTVTR